MIKAIKNRNNSKIKDIKSYSWENLIENTLPLWRYEIDEAIVRKKIACIVWDKIFPEWALMYKLDKYLEREFKIFSGSGYEIIYNSQYYTIWVTNI